MKTLRQLIDIVKEASEGQKTRADLFSQHFYKEKQKLANQLVALFSDGAGPVGQGALATEVDGAEGWLDDGTEFYDHWLGVYPEVFDQHILIILWGPQGQENATGQMEEANDYINASLHFMHNDDNFQEKIRYQVDDTFRLTGPSAGRSTLADIRKYCDKIYPTVMQALKRKTD